MQTPSATKLTTHKGAGRQPQTIGAKEKKVIADVLNMSACEISFQQLEEETVVPKSCIHCMYHGKGKAASRTTRKSTRPHLMEDNMTKRVGLSTENEDDPLENQVDLDEKLVYGYKPGGHIELHPGVKHRPKTPPQVEAPHPVHPCHHGHYEGSPAQTYRSCLAVREDQDLAMWDV